MADFQVKSPHNHWSPKFTHQPHFIRLINQTPTPLIQLEAELKMYYFLNRPLKRWIIIKHLLTLNPHYKISSSPIYPLSSNSSLSEIVNFIQTLLDSVDHQLNLAYHNKYHATAVYDRFKQLLNYHQLFAPNKQKLFIIAALMHDYSPHSYQTSSIPDELIAATEADFLAAHLDLSPFERYQIQEMIISTRMDQKPLSFLGNLLHAADVAGYIKPWPDWVAESAALIKEAGASTLNLQTLNDWVKFSLNFLHLAKSRTFHLIPYPWQKTLDEKIDILTHLQPSHPAFTPVKTHILPLLT